MGLKYFYNTAILPSSLHINFNQEDGFKINRLRDETIPCFDMCEWTQTNSFETMSYMNVYRYTICEEIYIFTTTKEYDFFNQ